MGAQVEMILKQPQQQLPTLVPQALFELAVVQAGGLLAIQPFHHRDEQLTGGGKRPQAVGLGRLGVVGHVSVVGCDGGRPDERAARRCFPPLAGRVRLWPSGS
ncbi:MAG: hypothetical protein ACRDUY_04975, partial [Nitriliruptorales bacterium]